MIGSLLVGFGLGLQHATDSDHIVAVTALASESSSVRRSALTGALWGLGHLMTLFVVGGALILLGVRMSPRMDWALELLVALVLIWLGVHTIRRCFTGRFHFHFHGHAGHSHSHLHFHSKTEPGHRHDAHACQARSRGLSLWSKSLMVGLAHGLAGSGGLALVVLSRAASRLTWFTGLRFVAGSASAVVGAVLIYRAFLANTFPF